MVVLEVALGLRLEQVAAVAQVKLVVMDRVPLVEMVELELHLRYLVHLSLMLAVVAVAVFLPEQGV